MPLVESRHSFGHGQHRSAQWRKIRLALRASAYQADFQITVSICLDALALMYASEIDARIGAHPVTLLQIIHGSYEHGAVDDLAP